MVNDNTVNLEQVYKTNKVKAKAREALMNKGAAELGPLGGVGVGGDGVGDGGPLGGVGPLGGGVGPLGVGVGGVGVGGVGVDGVEVGKWTNSAELTGAPAAKFNAAL